MLKLWIWTRVETGERVLQWNLLECADLLNAVSFNAVFIPLQRLLLPDLSLNFRSRLTLPTRKIYLICHPMLLLTLDLLGVT